MGRSKKEIQVGLLVILASVTLLAGLLWLKQFRFAGGTASYRVDFTSVDALQVRDRVQVRGIRVGKVQDLEIVDDFVRVTLSIRREVDLRRDAKIRLQTIGIVGEKVVEIDPGQGEPIQEGHIFKGEAEMSISNMGGTASETLGELRELAREVRQLVSDLRSEGKLTETLNAAGGAADGLGGILRDNRADIRSLIENMQESSSALRQALAGPDSVLLGVTAGAGRTFARADSALMHFEAAAASLAELAERLQAGEGTAGQLLNNESLYARAESTLASIEELVDDVRRNPRRFFKFSVIDF